MSPTPGLHVLVLQEDLEELLEQATNGVSVCDLGTRELERYARLSRAVDEAIDERDDAADAESVCSYERDIALLAYLLAPSILLGREPAGVDVGDRERLKALARAHVSDHDPEAPHG